MSRINDIATEEPIEARREGYKETKLGWIPKEWEVTKIKEIARVNPAKPKDLQDDTCVSFLGMADVSEEGKILDKSIKAYSEVQSGFTPFLDNDILVAKITPCFENGKGALVMGMENGIGFGSTEFHVLRAKPKASTSFLFYHTLNYSFRGKGILNMTGSAGQRRVPKAFIENYEIPLPPLPEQEKIAEILSCWDKAIEKLQKLIAAKEKGKKALMQQLLAGKKRFKEFEGQEWKEVRLGKYLIKHTEKAESSDQYPVLTSSREGLFLQKDYYSGREVASTDNTGYNVVPRGYFTYRHMSDDLIFKFNINNIVDKGIVSTLYPVFTTGKNLNKKFLLYKLNEGNEFKRLALREKQGGSRTYMYFSKLSNLKLLLPSIEEQNKIVDVILTAESELTILNKKLEGFQQQKKGLMQQLLTGKVRVNNK